MQNNDKWLIALINSISLHHWFFLGFGAITVLFIRLMMNHQAKMTQRNFRKDSDKTTSSRNKLTIVPTSKDNKIEKGD